MAEFNLKDYKLSDTIAALATFPAKSALGVIKISGKKSFDILEAVFLPKRKKKIKKEKNFTLHYGWIVENTGAAKKKLKKNLEKPVKLKYIDEVLVSIMRRPHSYTAEDVVEISCHGGPAVLSRILEIVLKKGARQANPGEFTYRALANKRINLLQASSVLSLIEAKTPEAAAASFSQLKGDNTEFFQEIKKDLKEIFTQTEALINFPEEEIVWDKKNFIKKINQAGKKINCLKEKQNKAKIFSEGIKCVICGRVNSGKSTLFNRLLTFERAIISRFAGTTRDVVGESVNMRGIPFKVYDTAGIFNSQDPVAKKAMEKTNKMFEQADVVILLFDGSKKFGRDDESFLKKIKNKNVILAVNKIDLPQKLKLGPEIAKKFPVIKISALNQSNLDKLKKALYQAVNCSRNPYDNSIFLSQRQKQELDFLSRAISQASAYLRQEKSIDFVNLKLKECLDSIGKISGQVYSDEILESVFSGFCIGK